MKIINVGIKFLNKITFTKLKIHFIKILESKIYTLIFFK
ncbi:hypothetical protein LMANV2_60073 [Leptospira interrogans serovar Manilae]|uniref:Uncharacterized protein n=1 Tax=Leptospira interrogans serovar Manilae TaxID=214675 RepID=A0AAQ1NZX7_LEPIR|nr:hypothetical protein LMANV2_60073 [Leptospira interrogans serovar Manilae]